MSKYIICCDFDGVLNSYNSGWTGDARNIPDGPVPGAMQWLVDMTDDIHFPEFEIAIYSSRSRHSGGINAIKTWLRKHLTEWHISMGDTPRVAESIAEMRIEQRLTFPTQKPAASMMIDDRAFHFQGLFPSVQWLRDFKPWNKQKASPQYALRARPSRKRIAEIEEAFERELGELQSTVNMDSSDAAIGDLLAEIRHLRGGRRDPLKKPPARDPLKVPKAAMGEPDEVFANPDGKIVGGMWITESGKHGHAKHVAARQSGEKCTCVECALGITNQDTP